MKSKLVLEKVADMHRHDTMVVFLFQTDLVHGGITAVMLSRYGSG